MSISEASFARINLDRWCSGVLGCLFVGTIVNGKDIVQKILVRNVEVEKKDHYYRYLHTQKSYKRCAILMIPVFGWLTVKLYDLRNKYQKDTLLRQGYEQANNKNYKEAFEFFKQAANLGSSKGFSKMGFYYENGLGVEKNHAEAIKCYKEAADRHFPYAPVHAIILEHANFSQPLNEENIKSIQRKLIEETCSKDEHHLTSMGYFIAIQYVEDHYRSTEDCIRWAKNIPKSRKEDVLKALLLCQILDYGTNLEAHGPTVSAVRNLKKDILSSNLPSNFTREELSSVLLAEELNKVFPDQD